MTKREVNRRYRAAHLEKEQERMRKWRKENPEKRREQDRRYREAHPEKDQEWRAAHPERAREYLREWREDNPEKTRLYDHNRRARKKGNGGSYTLDELNALFEEQEGLCYYCGRLLYESFETSFHIEHMVPISRGGSNNIENIALSCASCNLHKHTKTHEEFLSPMMTRYE